MQGHEILRQQEELLRKQMLSHTEEETKEEDMFPTVQAVWRRSDGCVQYTRQVLADLFGKVWFFVSHIMFYFSDYASVGGAPEAYGSSLVCVCV